MNRSTLLRKSVETLILGAGLTGLSAAYHLRGGALVVEAGESPGGTAGTLRHKGFSLDRGVHILYFRGPEIRRWIVEELQVPLEESSRSCAVWFAGRTVPFPMQFHLSALSWSWRWRLGLPALASLWLSGSNEETIYMTQWAQRHFGRALTREFFRPYNEKLWGVPFDHLHTLWMEDYVPPPSSKMVLRGLFSRRAKQSGLNARFWYPRAGGIATIAEALARRCSGIHYNTSLKSLDLEKRVARFHSGEEVSYRYLVSTIPLSTLIRAIEPARSGLSQHSTALHYNPTTIAHVLVARPGVGDGLHWMYVPDSSIPFYRLTFPHNISSTNCPPGWSAITLELGGTVLDRDHAQQRCTEALIGMGLLNRSECASEWLWDRLEHGYVTYDDSWWKTRHHIFSLLGEYNIICLGRYGRWEYSNMESALLQGRQIGRRLGVHHTQVDLTVSSPVPTTPISIYFSQHYPRRSRGLMGRVFRRGEDKRLRIMQQWLPSGEGLEILDAGCGDGVFLLNALHGVATRLRLEDYVPARVEEARQRLRHKADVIEAVMGDVRRSPDAARFDVILAIGLFDYNSDWLGLMESLLERSRGTLIADFPKAGTLHNILRLVWLRLHGIRLHSARRSKLDRLVTQPRSQVEVAELPLQWMVRIQKECSPGD